MYHVMYTVSFNYPNVPNKIYHYDIPFTYIRCGVMLSVDWYLVESPVGWNQRLWYFLFCCFAFTHHPVWRSNIIYQLHLTVLISHLITLYSSTDTIAAFFYPFIFQYFAYVLIYRIYNLQSTSIILNRNLKVKPSCYLPYCVTLQQ
jgi:hypothetical protein